MELAGLPVFLLTRDILVPVLASPLAALVCFVSLHRAAAKMNAAPRPETSRQAEPVAQRSALARRTAIKKVGFVSVVIVGATIGLASLHFRRAHTFTTPTSWTLLALFSILAARQCQLGFADRQRMRTAKVPFEPDQPERLVVFALGSVGFLLAGAAMFVLGAKPLLLFLQLAAFLVYLFSVWLRFRYLERGANLEWMDEGEGER